jgi:hypothetical protein
MPLTQVMEFTDSGGTAWLAYVEATPPVRRWRFLSEAVLPGRRLRFDSANESRATSTVPAGSPFLPEFRLQVLLSEAAALPATQAMEPASVNAWQHRWELVQAAARSVAGFCRSAAASAGKGLQHAISGYRTLMGRWAMAHHR